MVTMYLKGGLGNQLFQYALGRHLSLINNSPLLLDVSSFRHDKLRKYNLDQFNICAQIVPPQPKNSVANRLIQNTQLSKIYKRLFPLKTLIVENEFAFQPNILKSTAHAYLDGYWQSANYFDDIAPIIRSDLTLKEPISKKLTSFEAEIKSTNSVSIHVRRGDYVNNTATTSYHGLCSLDWYQYAFEKMQTLVKDAKYFVFSDDPDWVKANMKLNAPTFFMPKSPDGKEAEDLYLMSQCKRNIIANSSFSWWAAWLNSNPEKKVIAPARWFAGANHDTKDLIPKDWIQI